ncbi:hypothetical protein [Thermovirga lienii]|uniref:hypothetical protein n=1 Tax=Thermovirga lienii TaxID=336261 RepID=UPI002FE1BB9F
MFRKKHKNITGAILQSGAAQHAADKAVASGVVKGILSFATAPIAVPPGVLVYNVDIAAELEKLLFYLKSPAKEH